MTKLIELPTALPAGVPAPEERARWCCAQLEEGNILFFLQSPLELPPEDVEFLLTQRQSGARHHKNIAYRPSEDRITGYGNASQPARLHDVMRRYSQQAIRFASELLAPYAGDWQVDFTSFRPEEEKGRQIRLRARNDLLHTDSFPTRPVHGNRILRIFTNVNPRAPRVWITSETFEELVKRFAGSDELPLPKGLGRAKRWAAGCVRATGLGRKMSSPYDRWMLNFHHFLKAHEEFQRTAPRLRSEFPPGSTWLAFTDMVSHAVLSGQFALEQTLIVSRHSLVMPERAPVKILENLAGCALTLN